MGSGNKPSENGDLTKTFCNGLESVAQSKEDKITEASSEQTKETFPLVLGTWGACKVPIAVLAFGYLCGCYSLFPLESDPRVKDWPFMSSSLKPLALGILYVVCSVVWGPRFMKNREAYQTRKLMIAYNVVQVFLSAYMFLEVGLTGWFTGFNFFCEPCDRSDNPKAVRMASVAWVYFMSKIFDYTDTFFFLINKKFSQLSTLHVLHHSTMGVIVWFGVKYYPCGHLSFVYFINSAVHTVMYSYYLLASFGPKMRPYLWWKRYLTTFQLVQFVVMFVQAISAFFITCPSTSKGMPAVMSIFSTIFFALFADFYYRSYTHSGKRVKKSIDKMYDSTSEIVSKNSSIMNRTSSSITNLRRPPGLKFHMDSCLKNNNSNSKK